MQIDYTPTVHVQAVKPKKDYTDFLEVEDELKKSIAEQNAVFEVSKYPVKDTDVIRGNKVTEENVQKVKDLDKALTYKRPTSYGGLLKEIHKELNLADAEDGDLIHIDKDSDEVANGAVDVMAYWHVGLNNYGFLGGTPMLKPGERFYYCPGCKRFHEHGSQDHKGVNRKLCFFCDKIQTKKKIVGNDEDGRVQIYDKCLEG